VYRDVIEMFQLKEQQSLPGQRVNGEGAMIKLSGLSNCLLYSAY